MLTTTLGHTIVRRLTDAAELDDMAASIADDLLAVGRCVPPDDWLIVGGSLARGEPTFIRHGGQRLLISDVDFLYAHYGDRPSMPVAELIEITEKFFPTVDLMTFASGLPHHPYLIGTRLQERGPGGH